MQSCMWLHWPPLICTLLSFAVDFPRVWAARRKLCQEEASLDHLFWLPQHLVPFDTARRNRRILNYVTCFQILREINVLKYMVDFLSDQFQVFLLEENPHLLLSSIHCPLLSWSLWGVRGACCLSQRLGVFWSFLGVSVNCLHRNRLVYSKELASLSEIKSEWWRDEDGMEKDHT